MKKNVKTCYENVTAKTCLAVDKLKQVDGRRLPVTQGSGWPVERLLRIN